MYVKNAIENILHRYSSKKYHLIYEPINSLFDLAISLLPIKTLVIDNHRHIVNNTTYINDTDKNLYNYNAFVCNDILQYTQKHKYKPYLGVGSICYIHSYRPVNLKKEDLYLINHNLKNVNKVFFNQNSKLSWQCTEKAYVISYGIPKIFTDFKQPRKYSVGLFNFDNNEQTKIISSVLKNNNISYRIIDSYKTVVEDLNECEHTIEMNEHNIFNSLCSRACGCVNLMPEIVNIQQNYLGDIFTFNSIQQMLSLINKVKLSNNDSTQFLDKYNYDLFEKDMIKLYHTCNNEAVLL